MFIVQNAGLYGAQGLSLVRQVKGDNLPEGKNIISFDKKNALWIDACGDHRVPSVLRYDDDDFLFSLGHFEADWDGNFMVLCLCDSATLRLTR